MCKNSWEKWLWFIFGMLVGLLFFRDYSEIHESTEEMEMVRTVETVEDPVIIGSTSPDAISGVFSAVADIQIQEPEIEESNVEVVSSSTPESLGEFRITYYCCCEQCCGQWAQYHKTSTGTTPRANHTIAVDPSIIPLGTHVIIFGQEYVAEDTGAFSGRTIDIYLEDHNQGWALAHERGDYTEVYMKEDN